MLERLLQGRNITPALITADGSAFFKLNVIPKIQDHSRGVHLEPLGYRKVLAVLRVSDATIHANNSCRLHLVGYNGSLKAAVVVG